MINSDTIGNFITKKYAESKKYPIWDKKQLYGLINLDNTSLNNDQGQISSEIILLLMIFQKYYKKLIFNIFNMINYDIVLEVLWLRKYNPQINWK